MHRTHGELAEAKASLERAIEDGGLPWDNLFAILIDMIEDIDNLQFGGE